MENMKRSELPEDLAAVVRRALDEDIGSGDVTAMLIEPDRLASARVTLRESAVLCGTAWFDEVFRQLDARVAVAWQHADGELLEGNTTVCALEGPARSLLSGERTAINFLQTLSATATAARRYVDAVAGTGARILDTRKTLPGLRSAQKYATRCGGATNHRFGLFDAVLIKENHIAAAGSLELAVARAREQAPELLVVVEVENLDETAAALGSAANRLLLDNFSLADLTRAVELRNRSGAPHKDLEASGGVSLETVREIAATGVDYISVGALTKDIRAVDFSMRIG
jgi:nicotinate-nucleotide pyrophosphorylase (carboxylating)